MAIGIPGRTGSTRHTELGALNEIIKRLTDLRNTFSSSSGGGSTLVEQQTQTTLLGQILAETDYEHVITYGRDSLIATTMTIVNDTYTQYQGVDPTTPITSATPAANLIIANINNNFYADFESSVLTTSPTVDFSFSATIVSCAVGTGNIVVEFYGDTINLLGTVNLITNGSTGDIASYNFVYDNSITAYTTFNLRVYQTDSLGTITAEYDNFKDRVSTDFNGLVENILIKRIDLYEDNNLITTSYLDASDNLYNLVGVFIPNDNLDSTSIEQEINTILSNLSSKNSPTHEQLTDPNAVTYTGFKKLSFVCSGTIDVTLDGNVITYPFTLGSATILGSTIEADYSSLNTIEFDGTGTVLVTIQ